MKSGACSFGSDATTFGRKSTDAYYSLANGGSIGGNLTVSGNLIVDGSSTLIGPVTMQSIVTMENDLQVGGVMTVASDMSVEGTIFANNPGGSAGDALVIGGGGDLVVQGSSSIQNAGLTHTDTLVVDNNATFNGTISTYQGIQYIAAPGPIENMAGQLILGLGGGGFQYQGIFRLDPLRFAKNSIMFLTVAGFINPGGVVLVSAPVAIVDVDSEQRPIVSVSVDQTGATSGQIILNYFIINNTVPPTQQ